MKSVKRSLIVMLGMMMLISMVGCDDSNGGGGGNGATLKWPDELTPENGTGIFRRGYIYNSQEYINFNSFEDRSELIYTLSTSGYIFNLHFKLIEINNKKMSVEVVIGDETDYIVGDKYTLCTNYTIENGILTFTGISSNLQRFFDGAWHFYNENDLFIEEKYIGWYYYGESPYSYLIERNKVTEVEKNNPSKRTSYPALTDGTNLYIERSNGYDNQKLGTFYIYGDSIDLRTPNNDDFLKQSTPWPYGD